MKNMPLVSIVVPVYNVSNYIDKCLLSVRSQTYKNIEIIVVNDGSIDNSLYICQKHQKADNRIILINQNNQGLSEARNNAIKICKGDYLAFVDGDDYIDKNFIEFNISNIKLTGKDISMCCFFNTDGLNTPIPEYILNKKIKQKTLTKYQTLKLLANGTFQSFACNKIFNKNLFNNLRFKKGIYFEDVHIIHFLINKSNGLSIINNPLYYYLKRNDSITQTYSQKHIDDLYGGLFQRQSFFKEEKYKLLCSINLFTIKKMIQNHKITQNFLNFLFIDNNYLKSYKELFLISKIIFKFLCIKYFLIRLFNHFKRKITSK